MPDVSDIVLMLCAFVALIFVAVFAFGPPRSWGREPLGWVVFLYALSVAALLSLISYAMLAGERAPEYLRLPIALFLLSALTSKLYLLLRERRAGRLTHYHEREKEAS